MLSEWQGLPYGRNGVVEGISIQPPKPQELPRSQGFPWLGEQWARAVVGKEVRRALAGAGVRVEVR